MSGYPAQRPRRNRVDAFTRRLVAENKLSVDDLIWPIFGIEGQGIETEVASMPGIERVTLDRLAAHVEPAAKLVENVGEQTVNLPPAGGMVVVAGTPGLVLASVVLLTPPIASHVTR